MNENPIAVFDERVPPAETVAKSVEVAKILADVIRKQGLAIRVRGGEYVRLEGWTLLGAMLGLYPVVIWSLLKEDGSGYEARAEVRTKRGEVISSAEAECTVAESNWVDKPSYALRSMAQTRACSKALRIPLGFIMALAGFEPTPAEEVSDEEGERGAERKRPLQAPEAKAWLRQIGLTDEQSKNFIRACFLKHISWLKTVEEAQKAGVASVEDFERFIGEKNGGNGGGGNA